MPVNAAREQSGQLPVTPLPAALYSDTSSLGKRELVMNKTLIDLAIPLDEVLYSTPDESVFAANLADAVAGTAPAVYSDPRKFFRRTHPASGLVDLLRIALGRLSGTRPDEPPIMRVDTNLGGGKTHNLIALCHACHGGIPTGREEVFLGTGWEGFLRSAHDIRLGIFVGTDAGVSRSDRTLWGQLGQQIGGDIGYALLQADDEGRTAPGAARLKTLLSDNPNLIVIDEIAHYLEKAKGVHVGETTLARQTLTFVMSLCEAASQLPRTVVVITTTQDSMVFREGTEETLGLLSELTGITGRQARLIQPSVEADIPKMLASRLFAQLDMSEVTAIVHSYQDTLQRAESIVGGLPQEMHSVRFGRRMEETWPFHPELIALLDKRLSTNPHFQRTRGALRLLARAVRLLWNGAERPLAIHSHHLDLSDDEIIRPQLTHALQRPAMDQVARADVADQQGTARASQIDGHQGGNYARRAGTVCFLESLTQTASHPTQGAILGSALRPGDDANQMLAAWERLRADAWYLHEERGGYRFKTEPSLTKMIQDQMDATLTSKARAAAKSLLEEMFSTRQAGTGGGVFTVYRMYDNEKAPDHKESVGLCLFDWTDFPGQQGVVNAEKTPDLVYRTWSHTDTGGLRSYRNRLVFVAPDATYFSDMEHTVKRRLALDTLVGQETLTESLSDTAKETLKSLHQEQQLHARVAVANVMSLVWYPKNNHELGLIRMKVDSTARAKRKQVDVIYEELDKQNKWMIAAGPDMDPAVLRQQMGLRLQGECTIGDIEDFMAQSGESRILLDKQKLLTLIQNGVRRREWEFRSAEGEWITVERGEIGRIEALPGNSIHPVGTAPKPIIVPPPPPPPPPPTSNIFQSHSSPSSALESIVDDAQSAGFDSVTELTLSWGVEGQVAATCLTRTFRVLAVSRSFSSVSVTVALNLETMHAGATAALSFKGAEPLAVPLEESAKNILRGGEGSIFEAEIVLCFQVPISLDGTWRQQLHTAVQGINVSTCTLQLTASKG